VDGSVHLPAFLLLTFETQPADTLVACPLLPLRFDRALQVLELRQIGPGQDELVTSAQAFLQQVDGARAQPAVAEVQQLSASSSKGRRRLKQQLARQERLKWSADKARMVQSSWREKQ